MKDLELLVLRVKRELNGWYDYLKLNHDEIDYARASASAWAYYNIGLIDINTVTRYIDDFAEICSKSERVETI